MRYKVDFEELPWESPMEGMRQRSVAEGDRRLRLVEYTEAMAPHWCERGHIGCILEGWLEIEFANQTLLFGPGDGLFIPPGAEHKHRAQVAGAPVRALFVEDL